MRTFHWLLIFNILLLFVLVTAFFNGKYYQPGMVHSEYMSMLQSGGSTANEPIILWLGLFFGFFMLGIVSFALLVGSAKKDPSLNKLIKSKLSYGLVGYILIFIAMVIIYWLYETNGSTGFLLGFPYPTTIMLFAFGFAPLSISVMYIVNFNRWILTPADEKEFERIMSSKRAENHQKINHDGQTES